MKCIDFYEMFAQKVMQRGFYCLPVVIVLFSFVFCGFPQKNYGMDETKMVEKFKRATPLYLSGQEYFVKEKFQKSREKLEKCIEILPEYADAWLLLAQIESKESNLDKAMADVQKAKLNLKLVAKFQAQNHARYLDSLRDQKTKWEDRIFLIEGKLNDSVSTLTTEQKQRLKMNIDEMKKNILRIDVETRANPGKMEDIPAEYFFVHGNIFFKMRQLNEARDQYLEAIQRDSAHANAYNNLASLYLMAGNYQKALDCLSQAETNGVSVNQKLKEAVLAALKK